MNQKIALESATAREIAESFEFLEKEERARVLKAFSKARARTLTLYGAEAIAKLSEDFLLAKSAVKSRLFKNAKRSRVWVGGNPMSLSKYSKAQDSAGTRVEKFGVIPGAFIMPTQGGNIVLAPETAPLPNWAQASGKPWFPRQRNGTKSTRGLVKIAVKSPKNFAARYANKPHYLNFFESAFQTELERNK